MAGVLHLPTVRRCDAVGMVRSRRELAFRQYFLWPRYVLTLNLVHRNMFLAAAPYFQRRFESSDWLLTHFQSAIISVSTVTNLGSVIVLTRLQSQASYPKRIASSLVVNNICFTLLALSTVFFRHVSADSYFGFLMLMVFAASLATGLSQNGVFAFVSGFGREEYTQAIMTGQAIAGVLPCIAREALPIIVTPQVTDSNTEIVSVLSVPPKDAEDAPESSVSAFSYFLTATAVSTLALLAFLYLVRRHTSHRGNSEFVDVRDGAEQEESAERKVVGFWTLCKKLRWLATAVFLCFAVTMVFPVFTQEILSIQDSSTSPRLFQRASFIPLAFLLWNAGDLVGRLLTLVPQLRLIQYPRFLFTFSLLRLVFIPLYLLCNIRGGGAVINSDTFYLIVVQFLFGLSNGWLGSNCMMGAVEWVDFDEREAAGGFMSLMLVAGLTVGSLLSFLAARA